MGTEVTVNIWVEQGNDPDRMDTVFADVRSLFQDQEQRFSRFRPDSELSTLNNNRHITDPSADLVEVIRRARGWHVATGGAFNPSIHDALVSAGYDRDFEELRNLPDATSVTAQPAFSFLGLVDLSDGVVLTVPGIRIDFGGIVKSWTADRAAELALRQGDGVLIDAGGDIAVGGFAPQPDGWYVGVNDPWGSALLADFLTVGKGGVATSSTLVRRWGDGRVHHIIDPWTGSPSSSEIAAATVLAGTAEAAEVIAKSAIVLGEARAIRLVKAFDVKGILFRHDGTALRIGLPEARFEEIHCRMVMAEN